MLNKKEVEELNQKTNEVEKQFEFWNHDKTMKNYIKWLQRIYRNFGGDKDNAI